MTLSKQFSYRQNSIPFLLSLWKKNSKLVKKMRLSLQRRYLDRAKSRFLTIKSKSYLFANRAILKSLIGRRRKTLYFSMLSEKNLVRQYTPKLLERTFSNLFQNSPNLSSFFSSLESRADRVISRVYSDSSSIHQTQFISHQHFSLLPLCNLQSSTILQVGSILISNSLKTGVHWPISNYLLADHRMNAVLYLRYPRLNDYLFSKRPNISKVAQFYRGRRS